MPSTKNYIMIRTEDEVIKKFRYIAETDRRSMSNLGEGIILKYIEEYEQLHGTIAKETD